MFFVHMTLPQDTLSTTRPSYLNILLTEYTPVRQLRSSNTRLLQQPRSSIDMARHAFSRVAPTVCNNLPTDIRFADSFMNFRSLLHTHFHRPGARFSKNLRKNPKFSVSFS